MKKGMERKDSPSLQAPPGAFFWKTADGFVLGGTTRNAASLLLVPTLLVVGFLPVVLLLSAQFRSGEFSWFLSVICLFFVGVSLFVGYFTMMSLYGKVVLVVNGDDAMISKGFGSIGSKRCFDWSKIERVMHGEHEELSDPHYALFLESSNQEPIEFAGEISMERRRFMYQAIKEALFQA